MTKQDKRIDFYCKGYIEGYKAACRDAAEELVAQAHYNHVDLSRMTEVKRVAREIREMFDK